MARRRSLNRRWSRRSINGSAVLDQDSNYIDEEDDTYWRHLPNQTRYSNTSVNVSSKVFLNSNSRIIDDDDIEATEWWNHLQKTSQDLVVPEAIARTEVSNSDLANRSSATSHSDAPSITEVIKKKRVMLGAKRKSSGKNPFSQALDSSDIAVESEPISSLKRKDTSRNLSRSIEEGVRRSKRSRISNKFNLRNSPDSNTSTDTEKRSKARPLLFRRPKRKSSSALDKILLEDDSIVEPSQPSNANKNKTLYDENIIQGNNEVTNKTEEFMTQPRSPFDKLRRSPRKSKRTIITESQENEDRQESFQNKDQRSINTTVEGTDHTKIYNSIDNIEKTKEIITKVRSSVGKIERATKKSVDNSMNEEKNEVLEDVIETIDTSIKNRGRRSHKQSSDSDNHFKLQLSDGRISENDSYEKVNNEADSPLKIDDRSSPIRSRRNLQISSPSSSESEIIETRKSKQINDDSSDQNNVKSIENIRNESKPKKSRSKLLSVNQQLNVQREESSIVNPENETHQNNSSENTSSTESILEFQKSGYQSSGVQQEQLNSPNLLHQDESANRESEKEMESEVGEYNEGSNNMSVKSIQELAVEENQINDKSEQQSRVMTSNRISIDKTKLALKRQLAEVSQHDGEDEKESRLKEKKSISHRKSRGSSRQRMINSSLSNDTKEPSFEKRGISNNKSSVSLKQRITQEIPSTHEDEEQSESKEDTQNNNAEKTSKSFRKRLTQLNSSTDEDREDEAGKSQKSLRNRRTKETSLSYRGEEQESEEDTQNNNAEKTSKSFRKRLTQLNSSTDEDREDEAGKSQKSLRNRRTKETSLSYRGEEQESDEDREDETEKSQKSFKKRRTQPSSLIDDDERESESTEEKENATEEIQESIKQRKLLSTASISRKLFSENLEDRSSIMSESSKRSKESSRGNRIIDPSAYELPNRTRSDSYSESETDDVHKDPVITNDEPMQSMTDNNINLPGPSTNAQTPLSSSFANQRSKLLKRSELSKINTLDRYLLSSRSKLASNHPRHIGRSEDDLLSQEQLQELGDKLKKIKEKTDKITEKEVKQVQEKTAKLQNFAETRPTVRNNLKNKNKTPKSVNKAYIVNGQVYKQPKLPRPQKWATNRLYKYLWKKMEPKYNLDARIKSEQFVTYLSDVVKIIKRRKQFTNYETDLNELIKKMARLGIIKTRMDFHNFCYDFLPYEFRVKVTPMLMPGNVRNIPFDPDTLTDPIINKQ